MRILLRRIVSITNNSLSKSFVRHASSEAAKKNESKPAEPAAAAAPTDQKKENKVTEEVRKNIVVEKFGGVTTINIDRQHKRNSLDEATLREIAAALDAFDKDADAKVLVFSGQGGTFCAGFDLHELGVKGYMTLKDAARRLMNRPLCEKPTVAAVAGFAVAEGFELALACDLRVVEDTAVLGCLGRRFGAPMSLHGARRLTALVGLSRALELLMTGRLIGGADAAQMGLAAKLTVTGTALGESIKMAKCLCKFPQSALTMDKMDAINSQLNPNTEESMRDEAIMQSLLGTAIEDMKQGVDKFGKGIGKHGKFYQLTDVPLRDWELEHSQEETVVTCDHPPASAAGTPATPAGGRGPQ